MPRLTLTFDNGPTPGITEHVLDRLDEQGVKATFFVVAQDLDRPGVEDLVIECRTRGHAVGNHSLTHRTPLGVEPTLDHARKEVVEAQSRLEHLVSEDRWFRPFGGGGVLDHNLLSQPAVDLIVELGLSLALWNCVPRDWEDPTGWPDTVLEHVAGEAWTTLVLHDVATGAMDSLHAFLDRAADAGVEFVQDLPPSCAPIRHGRVVGSLAGLVAEVGC